jgi:hypothetical protein
VGFFTKQQCVGFSEILNIDINSPVFHIQDCRSSSFQTPQMRRPPISDTPKSRSVTSKGLGMRLDVSIHFSAVSLHVQSFDLASVGTESTIDTSRLWNVHANLIFPYHARIGSRNPKRGMNGSITESHYKISSPAYHDQRPVALSMLGETWITSQHRSTFLTSLSPARKIH